MYCNPTTVRRLAKSLSAITSEDLEAVSVAVDAEIDAAIGKNHYWPNDSAGNAIIVVPPLVAAIASYLVASVLEASTHAENDPEGPSSSYAAALRSRADAWLKQLLQGDLFIQTLERVDGPKTTATASDSDFVPVSSVNSTRFRTRPCL